MSATKLADKSKDELKEELTDLLQEQFNLRMQRGMGEEPRTHQFKAVRRNIARVKTFLNAIESGERK